MNIHELRAKVIERINSLPPDEVRVVDEIVAGLTTGLAVYGPLRINEDPRDMTAEALQELRDCVVYLTAAVLRARAGEADRGSVEDEAAQATSDTIPAEPVRGDEDVDPDWEREYD